MPHADWSRTEVEATVADYFAMLEHELRGEPFVKAQHIRGLAKLLERRSEGAIQFKYGNISAVLLDLGLPFLDGFKPYSNYQQLLFDVVRDRVSRDRPLLELIKGQVDGPAEPGAVENILEAEVEAPQKPEGDAYPVPARGRDRPGLRPIDYLAREARNRSLGEAGEAFVLDFERARLRKAGRSKLADRVERVSVTQGDWLGYDIKSYEVDGRDRFLEVKTTAYGRLTPFYVTRNEFMTSVDLTDKYELVRVFKFRERPRMFRLVGSLNQTCKLDPVTFMGSVG